MIEQIQELEGRTDALVRLVEQLRQANLALRRENESLQGQLAQLGVLQDSKSQLQNQVQQLEGEIESMAHKETQIRDRLRGILEKIDVLENELGGDPALPGQPG